MNEKEIELAKLLDKRKALSEILRTSSTIYPARIHTRIKEVNKEIAKTRVQLRKGI